VAKTAEELRYKLEGVTWIFHWLYSSGRKMALVSTQPLTQMNMMDTSWGVKATGA
jgi:hypothetical protein